MISTAPPNPRFPTLDWTSHKFIGDDVMEDQFRHQLSQMPYGVSDLGECMQAAAEIVVDDEESWIGAWARLARRIQERAEEADRNGRRVTAADAYLRASTYWRASLLHFAYPEDSRMSEYAISAYRCYDRYIELSGYPAEAVRIPYEDSFLFSYLYRSPIAAAKAPLLIFHQGRDAWTEDTRYVFDGAMRRGYHCLAVHGGGQGLSLRLNNLPFRHDWEAVITPAVDLALSLDGVDHDRIGLMGNSFGGWLAPRAAAFEHRIAALVANPGVLNWHTTVQRSLPPVLHEAYSEGPEAFNAAAASLRGHSKLIDWFLRDEVWKHGVATPYELIQEFEKCDLAPDAHRIQAPTLVLDGAEELFSVGEAEKLYEALTAPKDYVLLDRSTTAQLHCQNGATTTAAAVVFDWLDDHL